MTTEVPPRSAIDVVYTCSCGMELPLQGLYWCRHCVALRCSLCVSQEVDSFYSPDTLDEHMPSTEAKHAHNRCTSGSFECPICPTSLSYVLDGSADGTFQLECPHCQWNSSTIGLNGTKEDLQRAVENKFKGEHVEQFNQIISQYQLVAKSELRLQEARRHTVSQAISRKVGRGLYSKYTYKREGSAISRSKLRENLRDREKKYFDSTKNEWVEEEDDSTRLALRTSTTAEVPPVDVEALLGITDIGQVASLPQRFKNLTVQPTHYANMWPVPKRLLAKRTKRCRDCQHNLIKSDPNPTSVRFKMHLVASAHMPHLQVLEQGTVVNSGVECAVLVLQLTNPLDQGVAIALQPTVTPDAPPADAPAGDDGAAAATSVYGNSGEPRLPPRSSVVRAAPTLGVNSTVVLPQGVLSVAEHDPAHEYTPEEATGAGDGDDACIIKRQGNKLVFKLVITPQDGVSFDDALIVRVLLQTACVNFKYFREMYWIYWQCYVFLSLLLVTILSTYSCPRFVSSCTTSTRAPQLDFAVLLLRNQRNQQNVTFVFQ
eukprot:m.606176 g.606176  ORF g.606176 m.606176 type:complete len:544 (+) comp22470_c0_seq9:233-1864(+)